MHKTRKIEVESLSVGSVVELVTTHFFFFLCPLLLLLLFLLQRIVGLDGLSCHNMNWTAVSIESCLFSYTHSQYKLVSVGTDDERKKWDGGSFAALAVFICRRQDLWLVQASKRTNASSFIKYELEHRKSIYRQLSCFSANFFYSSSSIFICFSHFFFTYCCFGGSCFSW